MSNDEFTLLGEGLLEIEGFEYPYAMVRHPEPRDPARKERDWPINGYVAVPEGHSCYGIEYDDFYQRGWEVEVHCGLTYGQKSAPTHVQDYPGHWWFGFDTGHSNDSRQNTQTEWYVMGEIESLAKQLHRLREAMWLTFASMRDDGLYHLHQRNFKSREEAEEHIKVIAKFRNPVIIDLSYCRRSFARW